MVTPVRQLVRAARHFTPTWRYVFNFAPTLSYRLANAQLTGEAARIVNDLNRDGAATTSVQHLLGASSIYDELCADVAQRQNMLAERIAVARSGADDLSAIGRKTFILEYLGHNPTLDPEDVYARFALQCGILHIANAYLGMYTRLRYYNVWHTFATEAGARESQLWHRDRDDHLMLKVFLYLSDVDDGAGPFTYARRTHPKGSVVRHPEYHLEGSVRRSTDEQMASVVPRESWMRGLGPKGTLIFADTRGFHRGGLARTSDRLMYTAMFTSQASQSEEFMVRPAKLELPQDKMRAFALTTSRRGVRVRSNS